MKCDMQNTRICYNAKKLQRKTVFEIGVSFCIVCTIPFQVYLKNNLFRWTQQRLIYYISCKESLEYITLRFFLWGSWFFSTGAVFIVGVFWYTLALQLCTLIGEFSGSIFYWKSACWKNENVGFRICGSFGGMKCCQCKKRFNATIINCIGYSLLLSHLHYRKDLNLLLCYDQLQIWFLTLQHYFVLTFLLEFYVLND